MSIAFIAAAVLAAAPANVAETLAGAKPGDTIVLTGNHARIKLPERDFAPGIVIDATKARVAGVTLHNVAGVTWRGGQITALFGPAAKAASSYGFAVRDAARIRIENARVIRGNRGVVISDSEDIVMSGLKITQVSIDGVNVASSNDVTLEGSTIGPFKPPFMTETGPVHADGFQSWNGCTGLKIIDNVFVGKMSGITDFGRIGISPFSDGTVITGNRVEVAHTHGISITMTDNAVVRDNVIVTGKSAERFRATILRVRADTDACDNIVEDMPDGLGTQRCAGPPPAAGSEPRR